MSEDSDQSASESEETGSTGSGQTDDGVIPIEDEEDESSGFGSFAGFDLSEDLSDPEWSEDEIELPVSARSMPSESKLQTQETRRSLLLPQRQFTKREVCTKARNTVINRNGVLPADRKESIKGHRRRRRNVWKDAPKYDITCIVASPCSTRTRSDPSIIQPIQFNDSIKPIRRDHGNFGAKLNGHNNSNGSQRGNNGINGSPYGSHHSHNGSHQMSTMSSSTTSNSSASPSPTPQHHVPDLDHDDSEGLNHFVDTFMATVDDAPEVPDVSHFKIFSRPDMQSTRKLLGQEKKAKHTASQHSNHSNHAAKLAMKPPSLRQQDTPRKLPQSQSKIQRRVSSKVESLVPHSSIGHKVEHNMSLDITEGPAAQCYQSQFRVSHKIPKMKLEMIQSGASSSRPKRGVLQHFDVKGIQTLLYDGILSTIQKTMRFRTLCGSKRNIMSQLRGPNAPKLLHYIGHAEDGQLIVESDDDIGLRDWIDPKEQFLDKMTQCVVIQSPMHLEVAEVFLSLKEPPKHIIAIKQPEDNFAHHVTDFIHQFYYALIEGKTTIARAFATGLHLFEDASSIARRYRETIKHDFRLLPEQPPERELAPNEEIFYDLKADHELILFDSNKFEVGPPENYSDILAPHSYLLAVRPFVGRWPEVYKVMNMIRTKRLSLICSDREGCGRTSIITMAARYLWERNKFGGGVFHIKLNLNRPGIFDLNRYSNLAEMVLQTLSNADSAGYQEILDFYDSEGQTVIWRECPPSLLAVELLRRYVHRLDGTSHPICLLLSDFDEMQFPEEEKFRFVCAFMEQFQADPVSEMQRNQIASRLVLTANRKMVNKLHRFMSQYVGTSQITTSFQLQHQFGHREVKPLSDDDLISLFSQMIRITSTDVAYSRKEMRKCPKLLALFNHQPLRVKQVAEFALQTFDNNLSKQQFDPHQNELFSLLWDIESGSEDGASESDDDDRGIDSGLGRSHRYIPSIDFSTIPQFKQPSSMSVLTQQHYANAASLSVSRAASNPNAKGKRMSRQVRIGSPSIGARSPRGARTPRSPRRSKLFTVGQSTVRMVSLRSDAESSTLGTNASSAMLLKNRVNSCRAGIMTLSDGDGDILLTKRESNGLVKFTSTRDVHVDYSNGVLDLQKTFIRQKIRDAHTSHKLLQGLPRRRSSSANKNKVRNGQRPSLIGASTRMQTINSREPLIETSHSTAPRSSGLAPRRSNKLKIQPYHFGVRGQLADVPSGASMDDGSMNAFNVNGGNVMESLVECNEPLASLSPGFSDESFSPKTPTRLSTNKMESRSRLMPQRRGHKKSLSTSLPTPYTPYIPMTTQMSNGNMPDLRHQGSGALSTHNVTTPPSPSAERRHFTAVSTSRSVSYSSTCTVEDFIKQAWPSLDELVDGFKEREKKMKEIMEQQRRQQLLMQQQKQKQRPSITVDCSYESYSGYSNVPWDGNSNTSRTPTREHRQHRPQITFTKMEEPMPHTPTSEERKTEFKRPNLTINVSQNQLDQQPKFKRPCKPTAANCSGPNTPKLQRDSGANSIQSARPSRPSRPITCSPNHNVSNEIAELVNQDLSNDISAYTPRMTPTSSSGIYIKDATALSVWRESGGTLKKKLSLSDLVMELCNRCTQLIQPSQCQVVMDEHSIGPFFRTFAQNSTCEPPQVDKREFNDLWTWFDRLCEVMKDTISFWSRPIANYHGFITQSDAEGYLKQSMAGTFIVRFDAPNADIIVSVKEKRNKVRHESHQSFLRKHSSSGKRNRNRNRNRNRDAVKSWIYGNRMFQYVYSPHSKKVPKKGYFK